MSDATIEGNQSLVRKFIWVVGVSVMTASILGGASAIWTIITLPEKVQRNTEAITEIRTQTENLIIAINQQNLINNNISLGIENIVKQAERTNKLLTEINKTQSKLISKSVEQGVRVTNLERETYNK